MSSPIPDRKTKTTFPSLLVGWDGRRGKGQTPENRVRISRFDDLPAWYRDNTFIRHGYRTESNSALACLRSWLYVHNESVNIFTHLVPAVAIIVAQNWLQEQIAFHFPEATTLDRAIFSLNVFAALITFSLSVRKSKGGTSF